MLGMKDKNSTDIVELIYEDHKPLKELIKVLKDSEKPLDERREAYEEFAPLLVCHAKPEEETWYVKMKSKDGFREDAFEGDVEHGIADQLLEEIKRTTDADMWSARVKVLAELVEHHIEEEEEDMLPEYKQNSEPKEREEVGALFLQRKASYLERGGEDTVSERKAQKRPENPQIRH